MLNIDIDGEIVDAPTQEIMKNYWGDETSVSFKSFRDQVNASKAKTLNVSVNSGGGHVGDAMAIHDYLVELKGKGVTVNTAGRGIVASAATYIVMAGKDNSSMSANSWFMIHNVSGGIWGDVNEIENYSKTLRKFNNTIRDYYSNETGLPPETVSALMNKETWLTAQEAKDKGFVKNITGETNFKNAIKPEHWQFSNTTVLAAYNSFTKTVKNILSTSDQSFLEAMVPLNEQAITLAKEVLKTTQDPYVQSLAGGIIEDLTEQSEDMKEELNGTEDGDEDGAESNSNKKRPRMAGKYSINNKISTMDNTKSITDAISNGFTAMLAKLGLSNKADDKNVKDAQADFATVIENALKGIPAADEATIKNLVNSAITESFKTLPENFTQAITDATKGLATKDDIKDNLKKADLTTELEAFNKTMTASIVATLGGKSGGKDNDTILKNRMPKNRFAGATVWTGDN